MTTSHDSEAVPDMFLVRQPGTGRPIRLGEAGVVTLKVEGVQSGGRVTVYEFIAPPATAGPPLHLHRTWDETFYVLEGEMTFLIAGEEHVAPAGSCVFVPRGVLHTFWNASAGPARQLTFFNPAGIEAYFDDLTVLLAAESETGIDAAAALMSRHDMVVPADERPAYGALPASNPGNMETAPRRGGAGP